MKTMKRRAVEDGEDLKKKTIVENRRNSLAAAIEGDSERELVSRDKELEFKRVKLEADIEQRQLDREERKAEREHQLALAKIESEKMTNMIKALLDSRK